MKLLLGSVCAGLLTAVHGSAPLASVYTLESTPQHSPTALELDVVNPETARLILAHRLGLSQYHSLKGADEGTLRHLNELGGTQQMLFDDGAGDHGRLLIIVEGVQSPDR